MSNFYDLLLAKKLSGGGVAPTPSEMSSLEQYINGDTTVVSLDGLTNMITNAFYYGPVTEIDTKSVQTIQNNACYGAQQLRSINLRRVRTIGANAFYGCNSLESIEFPATLTTIGAYAFRNCPKLTVARFHSKPVEIFNVFMGCSKLTDIYVPWAEGEMSGATWGVNATIHYNS